MKISKGPLAALGCAGGALTQFYRWRVRRGVRFASAAFAGVLCALSFANVAMFGQQIPRLITKAEEIRGLSPTEAHHAYPVQLRAVVTFFDPQFGYLFVHDSSGSVYVDATHMPGLSLRAGEMVNIDGLTGAGLFAPIVERPKIHVLGEGPLPEPSQSSFDRLLTGEEDGQWVSIQGIVRSATYVSGYSTPSARSFFAEYPSHWQSFAVFSHG